jgi:hypothetical protein
LEEIPVENFDSDVAVESGCYQAGADGEHVTNYLPGVGGDTLVCYLYSGPLSEL